MKISTNFKSAYHFFYVVLFAAALYWWHHQSMLPHTWLNYISLVNNKLAEILSDQNEIDVASFEKLANDYPAPEYEQLASKRALFAGKLLALEGDIKALILMTHYPPDYDETRLSQLKINWTDLGGILKNEQLSDTFLVSMIRTYFDEERFRQWELLFRKSQREEKIFLLVSLQRMAEAGIHALLQENNYMYQYHDAIWMRDVMLVMNTDPAPVAGRQFSVSLEPLWYSDSSWDYTWIRIGNQKFTFKNGVAHCPMQFDTPGVKEITAVLEVTNPATGQIEATPRTFKIEVTE